MRSRRNVIIALATWVVVLFVAGAVWRAFNPQKGEQVPPPQLQPRNVTSQQAGYYACLDLPRTARVLTEQKRKDFLARRVPHVDQTAALRGCDLALQR